MIRKRRNAERPAAVQKDLAGEAPLPVASPTTLARLVAWLKTFKGAIVAIAGVGAVLSGLAGYWNVYQTARIGVQSTSLLATVGKGDAGPLSIVVLPFANLTGDPQQAYVADGLTAAVTADLSRIRDVFIVSSATAFAYKDKAVTVQQIGQELGVRFALQGGVQRDGGKIRVNAQLADTTSNALLWSESFDGKQADLFALQDLVTIRVGNSVGREIVVAAARDSEARKNNPQAADLMLRARALDLKPQSLRVYEEQEALYRQVLLLAPSNALAIVGLAHSISVPAFNDLVADPVVRERKLVEARDLALRAKELDPSIANIYSTLALYAFAHGDLEGARHGDETALSLDPKNPTRYSNLAINYLHTGNPTKAVELLTQGIRLDPRRLPQTFLHNMGEAQFYLGNDQAAIEWLLKALDAGPGLAQTHAILAMAYARQGDDTRARAAVASLLRVDPKFSLLDTKPGPEYPAAARQHWEKKIAPAGRLAGLPE